MALNGALRKHEHRIASRFPNGELVSSNHGRVYRESWLLRKNRGFLRLS
jgi:hypothetical protein